MKHIARKNLSAEDVYVIYEEHKELARENEPKIADSEKAGSFQMDQKMIDLWTELGELEKDRFSFFDELVAQGIVFDKLVFKTYQKFAKK